MGWWECPTPARRVPSKRLQGLCVSVAGYKGELARPTEECGARWAPDSVDPNGMVGRCLGWMEDAGLWQVELFDAGFAAGLPEESLSVWEVPSVPDGGFDYVWCNEWDASFEGLGDSVNRALVKRGYCVLQMLAGSTIRSEVAKAVRERSDYMQFKAEVEEAYLGTDNRTKCLRLEPVELDEEASNPLEWCDHSMSLLTSAVISESWELDFLPCERSKGYARLPFANMQEKEQMRPKSIEDGFGIEEFLEFFERRKLCIMHLVENDGGHLRLYSQPDSGFEDIAIPLVRNRMVIFRHDRMSYSYEPEGDSLALQSWILTEALGHGIVEIPQFYMDNAVHCMSAIERFPIGCYGADKSWCMFMGGTDAQCEWPKTRWDVEPYYMDDREAPMYGKSYGKHGALLDIDHMTMFDNVMFDMTDEEAEHTSPLQRWTLEAGYMALHKAGHSKSTLKGARIGVFMGDMGNEWNTIDQPTKFSAFNFQASVNVSRLSYCLGLVGPTVTCDTACSASMIGITACRNMMLPNMFGSKPHLQEAVAMGVACYVSPFGWIGESASGDLSPLGRCFTFDRGATGYTRGEGIGGVVLKVGLEEEEAEGAGRLAVLAGCNSNCDGRSASLTAPHGPSQQECIRNSLQSANVDPYEVRISECHGTGTSLGDPIEVHAAIKVMAKGDRPWPLKFVSSKAHLGHTEACAGVCGFIKVALMLLSQVATPNPHLYCLNPHLDVKGYKCNFYNESCLTADSSGFAGISSFGFGGANTHGELWGRAKKGPLKKARRIELSAEEARHWVSRSLEGRVPEEPPPKLAVHDGGFGDE